jgi:hypothetical protein
VKSVDIEIEWMEEVERRDAPWKKDFSVGYIIFSRSNDPQLRVVVDDTWTVKRSVTRLKISAPSVDD